MKLFLFLVGIFVFCVLMLNPAIRRSWKMNLMYYHIG